MDEEEEKSKMDEEEEKVRDHDKQAFFNWDDPVEAAKQKALAAIKKAEEKMKDDEFKQSRTRELAQQHPLPEPREFEQKPRFTGNWFQRRRKRRAAARRAREDRA